MTTLMELDTVSRMPVIEMNKKSHFTWLMKMPVTCIKVQINNYSKMFLWRKTVK